MDIKIIYSDEHIVVCQKPVGIVSEETSDHTGLADLLRPTPNGYIGVVHRLDRGVGGVMVYAKSRLAAARLSTAVQTHTFKKEYLAVVHGTPLKPADRLQDLLFHDRIKNKTFVVDRARRGVKEAILDYEVIKTSEHTTLGALSLLRIALLTGRTHQIRVQFSSRGMPLVGDGKYGAHDRCDIMLFCHRLTFPHPVSGKEMSFSLDPEWEI